MPGGHQPPGGWRLLGRARVVRRAAAALAAGALVLLVAVPAHAQPVLPARVPDPSPVVAHAQELLASVNTTVHTTADGVAAPVTVALDGVAQTLSGGTNLGASSPPDVATARASTKTPTTAVTGRTRRAAMRDGRIVNTGPAAVLAFAQSATGLLALALAASLFLSFEAVLARRNPRLTTAPVDRREAELDFR